MVDSRNPTMRDYAIQSANGQYAAAMQRGTILYLELVEGQAAGEHVLRYGARAAGGRLVRVGLIYDYPGVGGVMYHGADIDLADVPRWFSTRGVPVVRVTRHQPR